MVFCKSRSCNSAFYKWLHQEILLPFIKALRKKYTPDDLESLACFQLDGESTQIGIYNDNAVVNDLNEANIMVVKPPGSTTAVTQPCDRGNIFRGSKATLKTINDTDVTWDTAAIDAIKEVFTLHRQKYFKLVPKTKKKESKNESKNEAENNSDPYPELKKLSMSAEHRSKEAVHQRIPPLQLLKKLSLLQRRPKLLKCSEYRCI